MSVFSTTVLLISSTNKYFVNGHLYKFSFENYREVFSHASLWGYIWQLDIPTRASWG